METSQIYLDCCNIDSALSDCLLHFLDALLRDNSILTTSMNLFFCSLHLCKLGFNQHYNHECLINPCLYACLQNGFIMSCSVYLLLEKFFLLHLCKPLCKGPVYMVPFISSCYCCTSRSSVSKHCMLGSSCRVVRTSNDSSNSLV